MPLTDEDIREILRIVDESPLDELRIETPDFTLHVARGGVLPSAQAARPDVSAAPAGQALAAPSPPVPPVPPVPAAPGAPAPPSASPEANGLLSIEAPMLGTFYRAEGPGQPPFVEVGSMIEPDTIVCIIEVMKMMNSVPAGVAGTIAEVCQPNAELVEYGAPLFRVKPA